MSHITIDLDSLPETLHAAGTFLVMLSGHSPTVDTPPVEEIEAAPPPPSIVEHAQAASPSTPPDDVDKTGRPWDERIHSANRKKNADGTWRKRKNLDAALYDQVMADIAPEPITETPPVPQAEPEPTEVFGGAATQQELPVEEGLTWPDVLRRLAGAKQQGKFDEALQTQVLESVGVSSLVLLANRKDLWEPVLMQLGA